MPYWLLGVSVTRIGSIGKTSSFVFGVESLAKSTVHIVYNHIQETTTRQKQALRQVIAEAMVMVERISKENCPVDTGRLRASITGQFVSEFQAVVGTGPQAPYGEHVHEGTGRMSGRPFLRQAVESIRSWWSAAVRRALN